MFWLKDIAKFQQTESSMRVDTVASITRKSLSNSKNMLTALFCYYGLLVLDFCSLYSFYFYKTKKDLGFAYTHADKRDKATVAIIVLSAIILCSYYLWYLMALINNVRLIMKQDKTTKVVFFVNQAVHAIMICSFVLGVYS